MSWEKWVILIIVAIVFICGLSFFSFLYIANKRKRNFHNLSAMITKIETNYNLIPTKQIVDSVFEIKIFDQNLDIYIEKSAYIEKSRINNSLMIFNAYLDLNRNKNQEVTSTNGTIQFDRDKQMITFVVPGQSKQVFKLQEIFYLQTAYDFKTGALILEIITYHGQNSGKFQFLFEKQLYLFNQFLFDLVQQK
ncbi:hypothetical protein [Williamsoniiplasma lucivorax]|uniref:Transmembrane protein n=1 Tax=Williamsoniiplasma lucivorax TaxID=209274 RepID=A0A2S5REW0_9MOLU|nr:hypothetical protein [Williamsoniiplasma lucivorax]PPE05752.1 hypothetical protein ELUCI_v1c00390 [Williamsoniiplasma lucivorax]